MLRHSYNLMLLFALSAMPVAAKKPSHSKLCSTAATSAKVQDYYANARPGVPLSVASRALALRESKVATGTAETQFKAVAGIYVREVWKTVDEWGGNTKVKLVFADGSHSFAVPSFVPLTQPDDTSDDFLDVYADDGRGIHSHIKAPEVGAVVAVDMPTTSSRHRTRAIALYNHDGRLIVAIYASLNLEDPDENAVRGFEKSWLALSALPKICG